MVGAIAAGRPLLITAVLAIGLAALAAVGFEDASVAFNSAGLSFLAALALSTAAPAGIAAIAPKGFWLRVIYAAFAAGLILALRRVALQSNFSAGPFDAGLALAVAAGATFLLSVAAPLWRAAVGLSLIGLAASILGVTGGLAMTAIETARAGAAEAAGASLGLAAGAGAALSVQLASAFARSFAEGGDNHDAAAAAARETAAPALFLLLAGVAAIAAATASQGASAQAAIGAARIAAASLAFALVVPLLVLGGALSLKGKTEAAAVIENRRRAMLRPFLAYVRRLLPPSSALAISAIVLIAAIVAAFETQTPAAAGEIATAAVVAIVGAVVFVSLRTALLATVFVIAAGRIASWAIDLAGLPAPTETARVAALALAAALLMQLFLAWRDRRNPRRKTREVVQMALADSLFSFIAASILACAAMAATEAAGLWSEGFDASLLAGSLALFGLLIAPPLMTAVGALFGRQ